MKINTESTTPVYLQVANLIKQDIKDRKLKANDMLPSDRVYCEEFSVSHMTIKKAIDLLVSEGLVIRKKGVGTFVATAKIKQSLFTLGGFTGDNKAAGRTPSSKVLRFEVGEASSEICKKLQLKENDRVINLRRLRMIDDEPVALENAYLSYECERFRDLLKHDFEKESLYYVLMHECNVEFGIGEETIEVSSATEEISMRLGAAVGKPIFFLTRVTYDKNEEPIEYVESVYRADKYMFSALLTT